MKTSSGLTRKGTATCEIPECLLLDEADNRKIACHLPSSLLLMDCLFQEVVEAVENLVNMMDLLSFF